VSEHGRDPLRFLALEEAAAIVGFDPAFLKQQLEDGSLGGIKRGREWRIPYRALELWVERIAQAAVGGPLSARPRGRPSAHQDGA
jgi:excisionase family DNA binding protein